MLWELIAIACAGLGTAGVILAIRSFSGQRLPLWIAPLGAGAAMLGFQIYNEYAWYEHQRSLLPQDVYVVREIQEHKLWRPWSLMYPQTVRFIAVRLGDQAINRVNPDLVLAEVYLFERRRSALQVPLAFHCSKAARANLTASLEIPEVGEELSDHWLPLDQDDPMLATVCRKARTNDRSKT